GRVDELDALQVRKRYFDLDLLDGVGAELAEQRLQSLRRHGPRAATAEPRARDGIGTESKDVRDRGRRQDARRRDVHAEQRVDERGFSRVELADDGRAHWARA